MVMRMFSRDFEFNLLPAMCIPHKERPAAGRRWPKAGGGAIDPPAIEIRVATSLTPALSHSLTFLRKQATSWERENEGTRDSLRNSDNSLLRLTFLAVVAVVLLATGKSLLADGPRTFRNPILPAAADPWVVRHTDGSYYLCGSSREGIFLLRSKALTDLAHGERKIIRPRLESGPSSRQVWAPEMHFLDGAWYVYFAASDGDNKNHRMYVLENRSADPYAGMFAEKGKIAVVNDDAWAIDGTVLERDGTRYFVWSSATGARLDPQVLCISRMSNPWTLESPAVEISRPTHRWERRGDPDVNEAPQALARGGRLFLVYSASGSWTDDYCLGLLSLKPAGDPLDPSAWTKHPEPVFQSANGVYGPGHCSFTKSPDGSEDWIVYHAAREKGSGWDRNVRMQPFQWDREGNPQFGMPAPINQSLPKPSGD